MKRIFCNIIVLSLSACATTMPYQPKIVTDKNPVDIVRQVIQEQPVKKAPRELTVTDTHIQIGTTYIKRSGPVRKQKPGYITIYFNNVGSPQLMKYFSDYYVVINNKNNEEKYRVRTSQEEQAKALIDALHTLSTKTIN